MMITVSASIPKKPDGDLALLKKSLQKHGYDFETMYGKISKLEAIRWLKYFDYMYHSKNKSVVSDELYDILYGHVKDHWPNAKYLKSVGHRIAPKKGRVEVQLPVYMPSQDKLKPGSAKLDKFLSDSDYILLGDKLDGISLYIVYLNGYPHAAYTRGDGERGQDVSGVLPALNIPKQIKIKSRLGVRSEFVIPGKRFNDKHSKSEGKGDFKTARNMGGGLLTRNEPSKAVSDFDVVCYEICEGPGAGSKLSSQLAFLKKNGFDTVRTKRVKDLSEQDLVDYLNKFKRTAKYAIDGIICTQDVPYRITRDNPKHAMAFKINSIADSRVVTVKSVEWNKSRHGKFIPRVVVDPIDLGGVEVQYFTGHNYFYIQNGFTQKEKRDAVKAGKKLPSRPIGPGAKIRVIRSGDVIPYIMEVITPSKRPSKPSSPFTLDSEGVHAMVEGDTSDQKQKRIAHFFSSKAMDVEGLKSGTIARLYEAGFDSIKKIMRLSSSQISALDGFQDRSADTLVKNIKKGLALNTTFARTAYASSVFGDKIGTIKLQEIIDFYPNIMDMVDLPYEMLRDKLTEVPSINKTADVLAKKLPRFKRFLEVHGITLLPEQSHKIKVTSSSLQGIKVLLTGIRDSNFVNQVKQNGGEEAKGVKTATVLITKQGYSNKKTDVAEQLNIPIMTIEAFRKKYKLD